MSLLAAALVVLGMALVFASVAGVPAFRPGTWMVALGLLVAAADGIRRALPPRGRP